MVVSAVNNEPLCRLLKLLYPDRNREHACDDMYNIKRQIQAFHDFQKAHGDWYEIAVHPWHARKIIDEQKLAVVISVEASNLFGKFPTSAGDFGAQLDDLYALGVRTLQPVHETDSRFAGAAPHRLQFELFQAVKWPTKVIEDLAKGTFGGYAYDAGKNSVGMRPDGARLVDLMVQRRMLIDTAHMSEQALDDYYAYVMSRYGGYPLYNSHVRFEALLNQKMRDHLRELVTPERQLAYYVKTGGMVGIRTGYDPMLQVEGAPTNNCDGSSRSIAQMVTYAHQKNLNIAFGSDLNGNIQQVGPRFGAGRCIVAREPNLRQWLDGKDPKDGNIDQGDPPARVSQEFSEKGLAHIGLLPDLLADLKVLKTPGVGKLDASVEAFLQMWERAYDVQLADATNAGCQDDTDCTEGWYCKQGFGPLDPNKCAHKLADGERCLNGRVCQSGQCDAAVCYTPRSVAMGGACRVHDECKIGTCSALDGITLGKCVCTQDAHCSAGNYCNTGAADIGTNVCKPQLARWAVCTKDHQCQADRCKSGLCSAPASVAMGDSCRFDDECRVGTCSAPIGGATSGTCVCKEDADCGAGFWCDVGFDTKTNRCKRKLDKGEECGPAGVNIGHRCKSGSCKFSGLKHTCQ
jgi:microsomal dipeptidase-like Zn-dependent dipeptidase